jgi:hypothetical protein
LKSIFFLQNRRSHQESWGNFETNMEFIHLRSNLFIHTK